MTDQRYFKVQIKKNYIFIFFKFDPMIEKKLKYPPSNSIIMIEAKQKELYCFYNKVYT